ncbi:MAG: chorismate mutase [Spirochaetes bacterium GWC1_27_15]|nr:MAG: chorismate mutase [Spirochaetes bacterium GWC1_27_15]
MREELKLENIRPVLIRLEETIIFSLIERALFPINKIIYKAGGIKIPNYNDSFMFYLLSETERVYARVRRYTAPDEHPFSLDLPEPHLTAMNYEWPIKRTNININNEILKIYINEILPLICKDQDDGNYGSSAVCDVNCLQALSKRIHYGKFVAESKYIADTENYNILIKNRDRERILATLTDEQVEKKVIERVKLKTSTYGQDPLDKNPNYKIKPEVIQDIYQNWVIPLTKEVEVLYLLARI